MGRFQCEAGKSACTPCGHDFTTTEQLSDGTWQAMEGADSEDRCLCKSGSRADPTNTRCTLCSRGMICEGGRFEEVTAGFSYHDERIWSCQGQHAVCPGGTLGDHCAEGRQGLACSECAENHVPRLDGTCQECSAGAQGISYTFFVFFAAGSVGYYYVSNSRVPSRSNLKDAVKLCVGFLIQTVQILGVVGLTAVSWPKSMSETMGAVSIFALDLELLDLPCVYGTGDVVLRYFSEIGVVLWALVSVCIAFAITQLLKTRAWTRPKVLNTLGALMNLAFLSVTRVAFTPFMCYEHPNGSRSVMKYPVVLCGGSDAHGAMLGGSCVVLAVVVTFVAWCCFIARYAPALTQKHGSKGQESMRFFIHRFSPTTWWWGLALMTRGLCFSLVSVVSDSPRLQMFFLMLIVVTYGVSVCAVWPWKVPLANAIEASMCVIFALEFATTGAEMEPENSPSWNTFLAVSIVVLYSAAAVPLLIAGVLMLLKGRNADLTALFLMATPRKEEDTAEKLVAAARELGTMDQASLEKGLRAMQQADVLALGNALRILGMHGFFQDIDFRSVGSKRGISQQGLGLREDPSAKPAAEVFSA